MSKKGKKTNWLNKFDKSVLNLVPKLFEILGWTTLLGFLQFVATTTNSWVVWTVYGISFLAMTLYIQVYFFSNLLRNTKGKRNFLSLLLGLVFAIGVWLLLNKVLDQLASSTIN